LFFSLKFGFKYQHFTSLCLRAIILTHILTAIHLTVKSKIMTGAFLRS
jgi:hypothetical protein